MQLLRYLIETGRVSFSAGWVEDDESRLSALDLVRRPTEVGHRWHFAGNGGSAKGGILDSREGYDDVAPLMGWSNVL